MTKVQRLVLALVLLPVGLLAGTDVFEMMGNMPAIARMPLATHVASWQALDVFMEPRMPVFTGCMFLLFLVAIAIFWKERRRAIFWTLIACFVMELVATVFTVTQQLPVNRAIMALDPAKLGDVAAVEALRQATLSHFNLLSLLCISAFVWLLFVGMMSAGETVQHESRFDRVHR